MGADRITLEAKDAFTAQHENLEGKHNELEEVVNQNKTTTNAAFKSAEEKTVADIAEAKESLEGKFNTKNTRIKAQLTNHDTNHEITKKHILYVDRKQDDTKESQDKHLGDTYGDCSKGVHKTWKECKAADCKWIQAQWQDRPAAEDKSADEEAGDAKQIEYLPCECSNPSPNSTGMCGGCGTQAEAARRRLSSDYASMRPSERALARRRLMNRPKSHTIVLEALLEEINRLN